MLHRASRRFRMSSSTACVAFIAGLTLAAGLPFTSMLPIAAAQAQPARTLRTELMKPRSHQALMRDAARPRVADDRDCLLEFPAPADACGTGTPRTPL